MNLPAQRLDTLAPGKKQGSNKAARQVILSSLVLPRDSPKLVCLYVFVANTEDLTKCTMFDMYIIIYGIDWHSVYRYSPTSRFTWSRALLGRVWSSPLKLFGSNAVLDCHSTAHLPLLSFKNPRMLFGNIADISPNSRHIRLPKFRPAIW